VPPTLLAIANANRLQRPPLSRSSRQKQQDVGKFAHDAALHFLARPKQYPLTDPEGALTWSRSSRASQVHTTTKRPGAGSSGCASTTVA